MVSLGDSSVDGAEEAGLDSTTMNDTGPDTSGGSDAADAGHSPCASGAQPVHLPEGFSQVLASAVDQGFGGGVSMALDENDDPLFAYLAVADSVQHGTPPGVCDPGTGSTIGCDAVYFTRWDQCAGAFTTPVVVDPVLNYNGGNPGDQFISLAYDRGTKEVGIAYLKLLPTDPNWADTYDAIYLATQKAGQSSFAIQQVSDNLRWGVTDVSSSDTPMLAMGGGKLVPDVHRDLRRAGLRVRPVPALRIEHDLPARRRRRRRR